MTRNKVEYKKLKHQEQPVQREATCLLDETRDVSNLQSTSEMGVNDDNETKNYLNKFRDNYFNLKK
jgi:hypothetical protein